MNATLRDPGSGCFAASTNGLASGNHFWEATSHALCEVIERDAVTLWRHRHTSAQDRLRLDLGTVQDTACRAVLDRLADAAMNVAVWDVTTGIGVSAFQCLVAEATGQIGHIGQGSGCHPEPEIAFLRALTEAVQVRTTYIAGSREDIQRSDYHTNTLTHRNKCARALMRPVEPMRDFASIASRQFVDLAAEVAWLVERLKAAEIEQAIVVDLTRPEFNIPVVRVVVPGLEGSDHLPDYTPGARARALARDAL